MINGKGIHPRQIRGTHGNDLNAQLRSLDLDVGELDVAFEKDAAGNVTAEIYTDVSTNPASVVKRVDYVYDALGTVQTETVTKGADKYRKTYTFDAEGTIEKIEVRRVVG